MVEDKAEFIFGVMRGAGRILDRRSGRTAYAPTLNKNKLKGGKEADEQKP